MDYINTIKIYRFSINKAIKRELNQNVGLDYKYDNNSLFDLFGHKELIPGGPAFSPEFSGLPVPAPLTIFQGSRAD